MKPQAILNRWFCCVLPLVIAASNCPGADSISDSKLKGGGSDTLDRCIKILKYGREHEYYEASKESAVIALGLLRDEAAIPVLVEHLENESEGHLRTQIVRALGWIGSTKAVPALEAALRDKYPHARKCAALALKQITGKDYEYDKTGLSELPRISVPSAEEAMRLESVAKEVERRRLERESGKKENK